MSAESLSSSFGPGINKGIDLESKTTALLNSLASSPESSLKIRDFVHNLLKGGRSGLEACNQVIREFKNDKKNDKQIRHFDHKIGQLKQLYFGSLNGAKSSEKLLLPDNIERLNKWKKYGFKEDLFYRNPDFVDFLFDAHLGSQMKLTQTCELQERDGEPALLVNGKWEKATDVLDKFEVRFDQKYKEKFIFEKETSHVYTYTDLGEGLVRFHPYDVGLTQPVSKIDRESYDKILVSANKFVREVNSDVLKEEPPTERTYILQIVSSRVNTDTKYSLFTENIYKLVNRKHPWIRLVEPDAKGEGANVYSVGFGSEKQPLLPFQTILGRFRSIDPWEYQAAERVVTNIAINKDEFERLQNFPEEFIAAQKTVGFNFISQNCCVGVREVISKATGIHVPIEISIDSLFLRITPDFFFNAVSRLDTAFKKISSLTGRVTPAIISGSISFVVNKVKTLYQATIAFRLAILGLFLGAGHVEKSGRKLSDPNEKLQAPVSRFRYWFDLSLHKINLPGILQEWQDKQASTCVYPRGYKGFAMVPLEEAKKKEGE